ncbi:MAG TPA: hypothetical protein ENN40_07055 [Candidatus Aminicenantes bacterium]|nr:hypothetical protein [Candidatus Aminicenantes bacterium]
MAPTYEELKKMTVAQLREMASEIEHEVLTGYSQLKKEHLIDAMCTALGIDKHVKREVVGLNKRAIKSRIKELKKKRNAAIDAHNHAEIKDARRRIHRLKRKIHKATQ